VSVLTEVEQTTAAEVLAALHERGYRDVEAHGALAPGVRIRHRGHQWPGAYTDGTGVVLHVTEKSPSAWSQSWHAADVEMVVLWDEPNLADTRLSGVAQYHVQVVGGGL